MQIHDMNKESNLTACLKQLANIKHSIISHDMSEDDIDESHDDFQSFKARIAR
jgi:hypothetical protein